MNTKLRTEAKNEFEKDFFKLMNNSVFEKTSKNQTNHKKNVFIYNTHYISLYHIYNVYIYNILPRIDEWTTMIGTISRIQLVAIAHNNYEHTNKTKKRIRCKPTVTGI